MNRKVFLHRWCYFMQLLKSRTPFDVLAVILFIFEQVLEQSGTGLRVKLTLETYTQLCKMEDITTGKISNGYHYGTVGAGLDARVRNA